MEPGFPRPLHRRVSYEWDSRVNVILNHCRIPAFHRVGPSGLRLSSCFAQPVAQHYDLSPTLANASYSSEANSKSNTSTAMSSPNCFITAR